MQSSAMPRIEAVANAIVGYGAPVATQVTIFTWLGLHASLDQDMPMGLIFTVVSFARSYALRRVFNLLGPHRKNLTPPTEMSASNSLPIPMIPSRRRRWTFIGISVRLGTKLSNGSLTISQWGTALCG